MLIGDIAQTPVQEVSFFVPGEPRPQGSKKHVGNGIMIESCKGLHNWRSDVKAFAFRSVPVDWDMTRPMFVELEFLFQRPKGHFTSKGAFSKRAPIHYVVNKNDIDKLTRAVLDSLTSVLYNDDGQVIELHAKRRYCDLGETQGAKILVSSAAEVYFG